MSINRQPSGVPTGGQFAANTHDEASGSLQDASSSVYALRVPDFAENQKINFRQDDREVFIQAEVDEDGDYAYRVGVEGDPQSERIESRLMDAKREAVSRLSGEPNAGDAVEMNAADVRPGDIVFFPAFEGGRDIDKPHEVTGIERSYGIMDRKMRMKISLDGVDANTLGEGAGEYFGTHPLRVIRGNRPEGRPERELTAEVKDSQRRYRRMGQDESFSESDKDAVVTAVLDPGSSGMVGAYANSMAQVAEDRGDHDFAVRLRAASERQRLADQPMSAIRDPRSIIESPDSPEELVERARNEMEGRRG